MKFAAHLDTMLQDVSLDERLETYASLGFEAYELWCWWDYDLDALRAKADSFELVPSAICTKFISLVDARKRDDYLAGLAETIEACKTLDCKIIISQVGDELAKLDRDTQKESLVAGLKRAAELLAETDLILSIEPLNLLVDHAGYFLVHSDEANEIVEEVNSPNVKMLFDVYHQQISEGNMIPNIRSYAHSISHYHLADHPGRVGLEYWPSENRDKEILKTVLETYG